MDDATATALANLAGKTGRPVNEWLDIARGLIPLGHRDAVAQLKTEYGIGHGYASSRPHPFVTHSRGRHNR